MDNLTELEPEKPKSNFSISKYGYRGMFGLGVAFVFLFFFIYSEMKLVAEFGAPPWDQDQRGDCGVVLTGGPARIAEGFSLLSQKRIKKLIVSGVNPKAKLHEIFPQLLFYGDILSTNIILEKRSKTTYGNAQQSAVLIDALQCKDIILITSQSHSYRAAKTFEAVLPKDYPIYNRPVVYGKRGGHPLDSFEESIKSLFYSIWAY